MMGAAVAGNKDHVIMWHPNNEQIRGLQLLGALTMAFLIGARFIPGLRRYGRQLGIGFAVLYIGFGVGVLIYGLLGF
jgi:hypothetical protein